MDKNCYPKQSVCEKIVSYEHTKLIADKIKNSVLEIIPKENHGSYIIHSEKLYDVLKKY